MLRVSLVRHGMTAGNKRRSFVGSSDQAVSEEGVEELMRFAGGYPPVQAVFISPLQRCRQTAEILYPGFDYRVVQDLRERSFGDYEDLTLEEILALPGNEAWDPNGDSKTIFPGGEDRNGFYTRVVTAFCKTCAASEAEGLTDIAFLVHGGVIMALMHLLCPPQKGYHDWWIGNGRGYLVDWDGQKLILRRGLGG